MSVAEFTANEHLYLLRFTDGLTQALSQSKGNLGWCKSPVFGSSQAWLIFTCRCFLISTLSFVHVLPACSKTPAAGAVGRDSHTLFQAALSKFSSSTPFSKHHHSSSPEVTSQLRELHRTPPVTRHVLRETLCPQRMHVY